AQTTHPRRIPAILRTTMASAQPDPFVTLGITPSASDEELRTAYRRLVQLHHPDHNNGSHESALRFAEVQEAYAHVKLMRKQATSGPATSTPAGDPAVEARLAAMEQELRAARDKRERAARAAAQEATRAAAQKAADDAAHAAATHARKATRYDEQGRASDEELGYYTTDDSFAKILDDFADQVSTRFSETHPPAQGGDGATKRRPRSVADWIDELGSRLTGESQRKKDE
ncbi:MAG TPA: J domain-containing protein, partial [Solirubrobacteraceae bacterium]